MHRIAIVAALAGALAGTSLAASAEAPAPARPHTWHRIEAAASSATLQTLSPAEARPAADTPAGNADTDASWLSTTNACLLLALVGAFGMLARRRLLD